MNKRVWLQRALLPLGLVTMQVMSLAPVVAQNAPTDDVSRRRRAIRDSARISSPAEEALARARVATESEDFAVAHNEYRAAIAAARDVAGMENVREEAMRGFAESGVKLALQRKAERRIPEAEQILREILKEQPEYGPALELLATLRPAAIPKVRGLTTTPPTTTTRHPTATARSRPAPAATAPPKRSVPTIVAPPAPREETPEERPEMSEEPPPSDAPAATEPAKKPLVKVYFGTDRLPSGTRGPSKYFGIEWNKAQNPLLTGVVTVSIPPGHREGQVERPGTFLYLWERREDEKKHFVLKELRVVRGNDFYGELRQEFDQRPDEDRSAFVYIHGFNVQFDDAAYATAQIAYDLGFKGVPMMFSWPSQGSVLAYNGDQDTVDFSSPNLQRFLERVARETGALRVHVMAHSMGNRLLTRALEGLVRQADIQPVFENVIMASPDVNARVFTGIWPQIKIAAKRFTLYASSDDKALIASRKAKGGADFTRLGEGGPNIFVIPGLDTIDASGIDTSLLGHSYEASCKPVRDDLGHLIGKGLAPSERRLPSSQNNEGLAYWRFPPSP